MISGLPIIVSEDQLNATEQPIESTIVPGQPPEPQQIPEAPEKTQIPPANIEETKTEIDDDIKN